MENSCCMVFILIGLCVQDDGSCLNKECQLSKEEEWWAQHEYDNEKGKEEPQPKKRKVLKNKPKVELQQ